jgi:hypothetical protein
MAYDKDYNMQGVIKKASNKDEGPQEDHKDMGRMKAKMELLEQLKKVAMDHMPLDADGGMVSMRVEKMESPESIAEPKDAHDMLVEESEGSLEEQLQYYQDMADKYKQKYEMAMKGEEHEDDEESSY